MGTPQKTSTGLPLVEHVYTIQGEGTFQGHAAYFIRLAGCDIGCFWCDTKHSWEKGKHSPVSIHEITRQAALSKASIAVVTGGEPTLYDLSALTKGLKGAGMRTHLETSGAYPLTGEWDWICLSPKKFKPPQSPIYPRVDELKIIVCRQSDFQWGEQQAVKVDKKCALLLQPEYTKQRKCIPLILEYIQQNPQWKISLQVHKYANIP